jgi:hypothetical protein
MRRSPNSWVENLALKRLLALHEQLLADESAVLYESWNAALPPAEPRIEQDVIERVLARAGGTHDG